MSPKLSSPALTGLKLRKEKHSERRNLMATNITTLGFTKLDLTKLVDWQQTIALQQNALQNAFTGTFAETGKIAGKGNVYFTPIKEILDKLELNRVSPLMAERTAVTSGLQSAIDDMMDTL